MLTTGMVDCAISYKMCYVAANPAMPDPPLPQDAHSQMHLNLMRYFMAEGVTVGQKVAWLATQTPRGGAGQFIPAEASATTSSSRNEEENDGGDESLQGELRIAWQYRKYIQQQPNSSSGSATAAASPKKAPSGGSARGGGAVEAGISRQWCRTYDLTKSMGPELPDRNGMVGMMRAGYRSYSSSSVRFHIRNFFLLPPLHRT